MGDNIVIAVVPDNEHEQNPHRILTNLFRTSLKFFQGLFRRDDQPPHHDPSQGKGAPTPPADQIPRPVTHPRTALQYFDHPIMVTIREQELGKSVFNLGAPIMIALLITNEGKSRTVLGHFVLTGLCAGCSAIWHGIAFRATSPQAAAIIEQSGIVVVLMSFNGLVASALPIQFAWVPIICGGLCVLPFVVAALPCNPFRHCLRCRRP